MSDYRLPLGSSIGFCKKNFYEQIKIAKELGFEYVDFDIAGFWEYPFRQALYYRNLQKGIDACHALGLKINGIHISFGTRWDPSDTVEKRRKKIVGRIVDSIKRTESAHPICYILHGSFEPIIGSAFREQKKQALLRSLPEICAATKSYVCLEILPRTCLLNTAAEAGEIVERAGIDNLRICLDTNHFLQEKTEEGILALGDKIATLHVSDHDYKDERHYLPGKGAVDWNAVLGALEQVGYKGVFNYEAKATLAEIKDNYEKLFADYNGKKR